MSVAPFLPRVHACSLFLSWADLNSKLSTSSRWLSRKLTAARAFLSDGVFPGSHRGVWGGRSYPHMPQQTTSSSLAVSLFTASSLPGHFWGNCFHLQSSSKAPMHTRVHTHTGLGDYSLLLLDIPQNLACPCRLWHRALKHLHSVHKAKSIRSSRKLMACH